MNRREFLGLTPAALAAVQQTSPHLSNVDPASQHLMHAHAAVAAGQVQPVLTRSGSNLRHGTYLSETKLTPLAIEKTQLRKLFSMVMPGDPRIEAQPLLVPSVAIGAATHDLCLCALMSNHVCAFDANTGAQLWAVQLGTPIKGSADIDAWQINPAWGILSTGVVDGTTLYVVTWSSPNGLTAQASHALHAVDIRSGAEVKPPIMLDAPAAVERKQRSSLTLTNVGGLKTLFIPWGTIQETNGGAHGYLTAVDLAKWQITAEWNSTSAGSGSGIWMAGQGPAADADGFLYIVTGNGSFDGVKNFGESFVKLQYTGSTIVPADWFTPFRDSDRDKDPAWDDMDLGSGGVVLLPAVDIAIASGRDFVGLVMGAGKDGILYVMRQAKMGRTQPGDFAGGGNYAQLAVPPEWFTYYNPASPAPANPTALNMLYADRTHHMHSTPVAYQSAKLGWVLYCGGENGNVRAWSVSQSGAVNFLGNGAEQASAQSPVPAGGMPGFMLALSANGDTGGVLWATCPDGDANQKITTGRLLAYDAENLGRYSDGTGALRLLWASPTYTYNKFCPPVVSGGRVYVATYDGHVDVYGL